MSIAKSSTGEREWRKRGGEKERGILNISKDLSNREPYPRKREKKIRRKRKKKKGGVPALPFNQSPSARKAGTKE